MSKNFRRDNVVLSSSLFMKKPDAYLIHKIPHGIRPTRLGALKKQRKKSKLKHGRNEREEKV